MAGKRARGGFTSHGETSAPAHSGLEGRGPTPVGHDQPSGMHGQSAQSYMGKPHEGAHSAFKETADDLHPNTQSFPKRQG
jgi:hypothetical protein